MAFMVVRTSHSSANPISEPGSSTSTTAKKDENVLGFSKLVCTRIPSTPIDWHGTSECILRKTTKKYLRLLPNSPRSPTPAPSPVRYKIREAGPINRGMFPTGPLDIGDLIFVERPFIVLPTPDIMNTFSTLRRRSLPSSDRLNDLLPVIFHRMSVDEASDFMALPNAYPGATLAAGPWLTNAISTDIGGESYNAKYGVVGRLLSRINHSCRPNCTMSFDPESFSMEVRATKAIGIDDEIVMSYCDPAQYDSVRSAHLLKNKIRCSCLSCKRDFKDDSEEFRSTINIRLRELEDQRIPADLNAAHPLDLYSKFIQSGKIPLVEHSVAKKLYDEIYSLLCDMEREGLDGCSCYAVGWEIYTRACVGMAGDDDPWGDEEIVKALQTMAWMTLAYKGSFRAPMYDALKERGLLPD